MACAASTSQPPTTAMRLVFPLSNPMPTPTFTQSKQIPAVGGHLPGPTLCSNKMTITVSFCSGALPTGTLLSYLTTLGCSHELGAAHPPKGSFPTRTGLDTELRALLLAVGTWENLILLA